MNNLKTSDFFYDLPQELIAQTPVEPRDAARMLVYRKDTGEIEHRRFSDLVDYLKAGDLLVVNNTKVIPARIHGHRSSGGKVEFLLHKRLNLTDWEVLVKPARKAMPGQTIEFSSELSALVLSCGEEGARIVRFAFDGVFEDILSKLGEMPLPHYIHEPLKDSERYQTVYAKNSGSCAAPTAGLHFTSELLKKICDIGVEIAEVTLQVGLGTFRPVKTELITEHIMHSEAYMISSEAAEKINRAKAEGRRVIAVGTTSVRVLESAADENGRLCEKCESTSIFIYPPYKFKVIDGLITNFHLPESTLIMLGSAFLGRKQTLALYATAVKEKYRFFSFGDSCLFI